MRVERQVLFWLAAGLFLLLSILALKEVLLPFLAGMVIAYALNPIADRLEGMGLPRAIASALLVAMLILLLVIVIVLLAPILINQLQQAVVTVPVEVAKLKSMLELWARERLGSHFPEFQAGLDRAAADLSSNWGTVAGTVAQSVWSQGRALVSFVAVLLITPLVVFYLLVDWNRMLRKIEKWLPRDHERTIRRLAGEVNDAISAFIRGQGVVCMILGTIYAVGLSAAGLRYGLLIGLAAGILSFVPFLGWSLGLITASALAVVQFWPDPTPLFVVLGVFTLGQALDAAFLSPQIVGTKIGLHPVWLILSLVVFSYLFGMVGVLVAVPLAAAFGVLVRFSLEIYMQSAIYKGTGADGGHMSGP